MEIILPQRAPSDAKVFTTEISEGLVIEESFNHAVGNLCDS